MSKFIALLSALVLLQLAPVTVVRASADEQLMLHAGETRVITENDVTRLAVGNGKVLSAAVLDDREILLIANEVGVSSLHIWRKNGQRRQLTVSVMPANTAQVQRELATFLARIPQASAQIIGDKVVVEGERLSNRDHARIETLSKHYPQLLNFTSPLGWEKMIVMDVHIVEFPVSMLREVGLNWQASGGGAFGALWSPLRRGQLPIRVEPGGNPPVSGSDGQLAQPGSSLNLLGTINAGLGAELRLLEQQGSATILARPILSTRNGAEASFLAGGEFPYSVSNANGSTIQFKPYGIRLEITPTLDDSGVIRARIMSEVSDLDPSVRSDSGPALRTRKTSTEFNVLDGGTIVLSGLLTRDQSRSVDKLPFLGDLPVLGALFRSQRYQNKETELVVFVTPQAVDEHSLELASSMARAQAQLAAPQLPQPPLPPPGSGSGSEQEDVHRWWQVN